MDGRKYMIVDLEDSDKKKFKTEQVKSIKKTTEGYWRVSFLFSPDRYFTYNPARLIFLTDPEMIELDGKGVYVKNKHITNLKELLRFSNGRYTFYRLIYTNREICYSAEKNVYITRTPIDKIGGSTWEYLQKLADETGLLNKDTGENILSKRYNLIDLNRDNVPLAQYLGDRTKLRTYRLPNYIYYPFGCNASQKAAVEAALTHQVSIIQGPPGTGKTQTILNIIANLLMSKKTVLVVSNNNSAVENIAEKLECADLGFLVAKLGNSENKATFVKQKVKDYPNDMATWVIDKNMAMEQVEKSLVAVSMGFEGEIKLAELKAEQDALMTEKQHIDMLKDTFSKDYEWLNSKPSAKLMTLLNLCQIMVEHEQEPNFWFRLRWSFILGLPLFSFLKGNLPQVIECLEYAYYHTRLSEIDQRMADINKNLEIIDIKQKIKELKETSFQILKSEIAQRCSNETRPFFNIVDIKTQSENFLKEYPIVLSSTYSANNCIDKNMVFDYVIMDEASQVDIKTGVLSLSCAMNIVIVGDDKQLPNVVSEKDKKAFNAIQSLYNVDECYNGLTHNFLQSCTEIFKDAPTTLLREHYRCHPKIIEFCNQRFYDGELLAMTKDSGEDKVLKVVRTAKGNHARKEETKSNNGEPITIHFNQREIDVIKDLMTEYGNNDSVGIITPYVGQAKKINKALNKDIASTVHKYQGRECDTIIISTVDDTPTSFSDDARLLNVAISRAKSHLCIVTTGNKIAEDTNLYQLIAYVQHNNCEVENSKLHSVFDLLYKQYTAERLAYQKEHLPVSDYLSENLVYDILIEALKELELNNLSVLCHYPLSKLISEWTLLNEQQRVFAESPLAHVDFLVYSSLTKRPLLAIEVDGWHFHKNNEVQAFRDNLKDEILDKYGLAPHRISTIDIVTMETMKEMLEYKLHIKKQG